MQIHLIESGDAEVIVFGEMSKTSFFFFIIISGGGGCFMKSILNKSYHRPQALRHSFVICGCGCVFNFLSIKSKYAVFFFLPPLWNLNKRSQHQPTGEEYSFCCCLIQQALIFFAFFPARRSQFFDGMFSKHLMRSKFAKEQKLIMYVWLIIRLNVNDLEIELDCILGLWGHWLLLTLI